MPQTSRNEYCLIYMYMFYDTKTNNKLPIDFGREFHRHLENGIYKLSVLSLFFLRLKDKFQINWVYYAISLWLVLKMQFKCSIEFKPYYLSISRYAAPSFNL